MMLLAIALLLQALPTDAGAATPDQTQSEPLWQKISYGMTPAQVADSLGATPGIKSAKARGSGKISISYEGTGWQVAGLSFKISPVFKDGALTAVGLLADDICANAAQVPIDQILRGLQSRHDAQPMYSEAENSNVDRALLRSYSTGEPVELGNAVVGDDIATSVILTVSSKRPSYYTGSSRGLAGSLGALSNSLNESRGNECGGHGFDRVNILLIYQRKSDFEASIAAARQANQKNSDEIEKAL